MVLLNRSKDSFARALYRYLLTSVVERREPPGAIGVSKELSTAKKTYI